MDDLYRDEVMDHYKNPRNFGPPTLKLRKGEEVVVAEEKNTGCGDEVKVSIKGQRVEGGGQKITDIKFQGQGCAVSVAFTSLLIEKVKEEGWGVEELEKKSEEELVKLVGGGEVSPARQKCLRMGIRALRQAVARLNQKPNTKNRKIR